VNHAKDSRDIGFEDEDTSSGGQKGGAGSQDSAEYEDVAPVGKVRIYTWSFFSSLRRSARPSRVVVSTLSQE